MTPRTLLASASRLARVRDLRARDRADVHALAERLVQLEARGTLPVRAQLAGRAAGGVVDAVARVGAHVDALQDDVVGLAAVRAGGADGEGRGREGLGCFGAEECCRSRLFLSHVDTEAFCCKAPGLRFSFGLRMRFLRFVFSAICVLSWPVV